MLSPSPLKKGNIRIDINDQVKRNQIMTMVKNRSQMLISIKLEKMDLLRRVNNSMLAGLIQMKQVFQEKNN